jgi:hypothetical protein
MSRWLRIGPLAVVGGLSLMCFYMASAFALGVGDVVGFMITPAYLWRVITGSALYAMVQSLVNTFWIKEFALVTVYMMPLLTADALIARLRTYCSSVT